MILDDCLISFFDFFFEKVSKCCNSKSDAIKTYPKNFGHPTGGRPASTAMASRKKEDVRSGILGGSDKSVNGLVNDDYYFYSDNTE